ncbi:DUF2333 family protein [Glaciecola sp. XM2]|uniref:DUF2333 family protein n=1 Tax=Glaciecola sp. XM2 TaxID=1914931 RepID=UPI001BDE1FF6|nr:DUF2333 family protein [Glaciecola sp. XM2]MBT1451135.1 DUF2333 family protein [Glaciecola sp. XM2]
MNIGTKSVSAVIASVLLIIGLIGFWWGFEPSTFDVDAKALETATANNERVVTGYTTTTALIEVMETLMNKSGGYLSNDVLPPGVLMDNIPSWEFGAIEMSRDLVLAMRKDFSRSQSQSLENPQLVKASPKLNFDHNRWILPSSEGEFQDGIDALKIYRSELSDIAERNSQFYARADNLREYLKQVEKRLGSLSQQLSASVGTEAFNTDLAGDSAARQSTPQSEKIITQTPWMQLDNNFYQARGASWALLHFLKAIETDFEDVLQKKNATVSLEQIIRELESTQTAVYSPVILNGSGFGFLANHSLVMANYISRANAALIELSELLNQG